MAQAQAEQQRKENWFLNYLNVAIRAKATLKTAQTELDGIETTLALILPQMLAVQEQVQEIGMKVDTGWSYGAVKALETARRVLKRNGSKGLPRATQLVCDVHSDFFDILRELRLNAEAEAEPGASEGHIRRIAHQKKQAGEKLGQAGDIGRPLNTLQGTFVELEAKYKVNARKVATNQLTTTEKFILSFYEKITAWRSKSNAPVEPDQDINPIPAAVVQQKPVASSSAALSPAPVVAAPSATDILELVPQMSVETVGFVTVNPDTPAIGLPRTDGVLEAVPHDYGSTHSNDWTKLFTQIKAPQFRKRNLAVGGTLLAGIGFALVALGGFGNKKPVDSSAPVRTAAVAQASRTDAVVQPQSNKGVIPEQDLAAPAAEEIKPSASIKIIPDDKVDQIVLKSDGLHQPSKRRLASHGWRLFSDKCALTLSEMSMSGVRNMLKDANSRKDFENGVIEDMKINGTREEHQLAFRVEAAMSNARNSVLVSRNNQKSPGPIPGY